MLNYAHASIKPGADALSEFPGRVDPGREGIGLPRCYLLLQVRNSDGEQQDTVLYWRMIAGELLAPGGAPWEHEHAAVGRAGLAARSAVKRFLEGQLNTGRVEESAVIAMPCDLKLT